MNHILPCGHECDRPSDTDATFTYHICQAAGSYLASGEVVHRCVDPQPKAERDAR